MRNIFAEVVFSKVDTDNNFCRNPFSKVDMMIQCLVANTAAMWNTCIAAVIFFLAFSVYGRFLRLFLGSLTVHDFVLSFVEIEHCIQFI